MRNYFACRCTGAEETPGERAAACPACAFVERGIALTMVGLFKAIVALSAPS